jgi:hypothetical protein
MPAARLRVLDDQGVPLAAVRLVSTESAFREVVVDEQAWQAVSDQQGIVRLGDVAPESIGILAVGAGLACSRRDICSEASLL